MTFSYCTCMSPVDLRLVETENFQRLIGPQQCSKYCQTTEKIAYCYNKTKKKVSASKKFVLTTNRKQ